MENPFLAGAAVDPHRLFALHSCVGYLGEFCRLEIVSIYEGAILENGPLGKDRYYNLWRNKSEDPEYAAAIHTYLHNHLSQNVVNVAPWARPIFRFVLNRFAVVP